MAEKIYIRHKKLNNITFQLFWLSQCSLFLSKLHNLLVNLQPLPLLDSIHVLARRVLGVCLLPEVQDLLLRGWNPVRVNVKHLPVSEDELRHSQPACLFPAICYVVLSNKILRLICILLDWLTVTLLSNLESLTNPSQFALCSYKIRRVKVFYDVSICTNSIAKFFFFRLKIEPFNSKKQLDFLKYFFLLWNISI